MQRLTTAQAARVVGLDPRNAAAMLGRFARAIGAVELDERPRARPWGAGEVVAISIVRALDPHAVKPERWGAGAARVADAHERGLCPAYLVTAGDDEFGVLLDHEGVERAVAELVRALAQHGVAVRVVAISPIVEDLCDVLDRRALA
jgi:hypothetical protein